MKSPSQSLKALQTKRDKTKQELHSASVDARDAQQKVAKIKSRLVAIDKEIEDLTERDIVVSEHAMLRYCERVLKVDMTAVTKAILPEGVRIQVDTLGNGRFPVPGTSFAIKVKNGTVITVEDL
jgi:hypothetical protein